MIQFEDVIAKGHLGRVSYLTVGMWGNITWPLYDAEVLNPAEEEYFHDAAPDNENIYYLPTSGTIRKPLYVPVSSIDYAVWVA